MLTHVLLAMGASTALVICYALLVAARPRPLWDAHFVLPVLAALLAAAAAGVGEGLAAVFEGATSGAPSAALLGRREGTATSRNGRRMVSPEGRGSDQQNGRSTVLPEGKGSDQQVECKMVLPDGQTGNFGEALDVWVGETDGLEDRQTDRLASANQRTAGPWAGRRIGLDQSMHCRPSGGQTDWPRPINALPALGWTGQPMHGQHEWKYDRFFSLQCVAITPMHS
jgi:hypothetical protein